MKLGIVSKHLEIPAFLRNIWDSDLSAGVLQNCRRSRAGRFMRNYAIIYATHGLISEYLNSLISVLRRSTRHSDRFCIISLIRLIRLRAQSEFFVNSATSVPLPFCAGLVGLQFRCN